MICVGCDTTFYYSINFRLFIAMEITTDLLKYFNFKKVYILQH